MDDQDLSDEGRLRQLYTAGVEERQVGDRANCVAPEAILALVLGESPDAERLATLDHVMGCPACHRDYEYLSAVEEAGAKTERIAARRAPTWRRVLPLAAAASVVLAIGSLVVRDRLGLGGDDVERGGERAIAVYSPAGEVAAAGPVVFAWKPVPGAFRYVVEVLGPDGTVVFSDSTADTSATLARPGALTPGATYRWSVRTLEEAGEEPTVSPIRRFRAAGQ
jgi:hypothetical protein